MPVLCKVTVTTTDAALAARVEPNAPSPARRLEAVARLAEAGVFAGVLLMPVLPFLEDNVENLRAVVEAAAEAGALWAALEERCRALGLLCRMRDITAAYQRGYGERQLTFF